MRRNSVYMLFRDTPNAALFVLKTKCNNQCRLFTRTIVGNSLTEKKNKTHEFVWHESVSHVNFTCFTGSHGIYMFHLILWVSHGIHLGILRVFHLWSDVFHMRIYIFHMWSHGIHTGMFQKLTFHKCKAHVQDVKFMCFFCKIVRFSFSSVEAQDALNGQV